jgi:hypothetical protein
MEALWWLDKKDRVVDEEPISRLKVKALPCTFIQ